MTWAAYDKFGGVKQLSASPPTYTTAARPPGYQGQLIYDTDLDALLLFDGLFWNPVGPVGRSQLVSFSDDCMNRVGNITAMGMSQFNSGDGTCTEGTSEANHPGIWTFNTGTGTTNISGLYTQTTSVMLAQGATRFGAWVKTPNTLSAGGTQGYWLGVGFNDTGRISNGTNMAIVRYSDVSTGGNAKWEYQSKQGASNFVTDTGVTVATATWYYIIIDVNSNGNTTKVYIGTSGATPSLVVTDQNGVPTGAGNEVRPMIFIEKTTGATSRAFSADAYWFVSEMSTTR